MLEIRKPKGTAASKTAKNLVSIMSLSLKSATEKGRRRRRRELSEEQKQEIVEAFNLFDADKDQALDYHELKVVK